MPLTPRRGSDTQRSTTVTRSTPKSIEPPISGTWTTADDEPVDLEPDNTSASEIHEDAPRVSSFVRIIHNQVGPYSKDSILPVSTFEHLQHLLDLGAIAYDFDAKAEFLSGNQENIQSIFGIGQALMQNIPNAPWITAAAHDLLGTTYVSRISSIRSWTPTPEPSTVIPLGESYESYESEPASNIPEPVQTQHTEISSI